MKLHYLKDKWVLQNSKNCENATLGMASDIAKFLFEAQA